MTSRDQGIFTAVSVLFTLSLMAVVIAIGRYDALLLTTIFPVGWAAYRFQRRVYLLLLAVSVTASVIAVSHIFSDPTNSFQTIIVTAVTLAVLCEAIYQVVARRNELEAQLKAKDEQFNQIVSAIDQTVWLGNQRDFIYLSPTYKNIFGREFQGFPVPRLELMAFVVEEDKPAVEQFLRDQFLAPKEIDYKIRQPSGNIRHLRERAFPIPEQFGQLYRVAGILEDVTEKMALEDALRQAKKMEALGLLAASVAHDFNNVLTVIQSYAFLLKDEPRFDEKQVQLVTQIEAASERGNMLTKRLLAFTRQQKVERKLCDLNEVLKTLQGLILGLVDRSISLKLQTTSIPLPIFVDRSLLEQAVLNLVVNARDAMPEGGTITLMTSHCGGQNVGSEPFASVTIVDTGVGMTEATRKRLFEPFFTTKPVGRGTGLGLVAVDAFIKEHRGHITVQSEPGRGTTFTFFLPISSRKAKTDIPQPGASHVFIADRGTILLVDDDPSIRAVNKQLLNSYGYQVLDCRSGVSALQILGESSDSICLIIIDAILADGFSGIELAKELHSINPSLPVVFTGTSLPAESRAWSFVSESLPKPYEPSVLIAAVKRLLKLKGEVGRSLSDGRNNARWICN